MLSQLSEKVHVPVMSGRVVAFFTGLIVYALIGSPTPDTIGLGEVIIAVLLLPALSIPKLADLPAAAGAVLLYGLSVPLLTGIVAGHDPGSILRDLVPFLFLLLPVFYLPLLKAHPTGMVTVLAVVGFIFAVRALIPYQNVMSNPLLWFGRPPADLLYLANSPEVLFAALLLLGGGGVLIWTGRAVLGGTAMVLAAIIPMLAMAVMMQRAGLGCVALAASIWAGLGLWVRPARMLPVAGIAALILLPLTPYIGLLLGSLAYKTELVGLNSRGQEWAAVIDLAGNSLGSALFGLGWGTVFDNPAVGNLPVNYTHSLISALFLKTGLCGTALVLVYLWTLAKQAVPELFRRPILVISLLAPLGIGLLLYASYKSLGFGLILLLLALVPAYRNLAQKPPDMA